MNHDLHDYAMQLTMKMEAEYLRIQKTASLDPGTAGDEGEENWASLLKEWLPPAYRVVTKGQLLDSSGCLSPQVDVIVLKPSYPPALHHKKKYLVAGVAAAFECKVTFKMSHIAKFLRCAALIKQMTGRGEGSPYAELTTEPIYGLLAHSHAQRISRNPGNAVDKISLHLAEEDERTIQHPSEMPDLLCISDLGTWVAEKLPLYSPGAFLSPKYERIIDARASPGSYYRCHSDLVDSDGDDEQLTPVGQFLTELLTKLAWQDRSLRDIAGYFSDVGFTRSMHFKLRKWPRTIYSPDLKAKLRLEKLEPGFSWSEWQWCVP